MGTGSAPGQNLKAGIDINNSSGLLLSIYLVPGAALRLYSLLYNLYNSFVKWVLLAVYRNKLRHRGRVRSHPNSHGRQGLESASVGCKP